MGMEVAFVRHRGRRDQVYVTRSDGTVARWAFPSYGDDLPHDLCHLVVEDALGIAHGFWGLVEGGMDVQVIANQATLVRDGKPLIEGPNVDFSDLNRAEQAVALVGPIGMRIEETGTLTTVRLDPSASPPAGAGQLGVESGFELPEGTSEERVRSIRNRLGDLRRQWQSLDDGTAIILTYPGTP
jgi:hypothetical protein